MQRLAPAAVLCLLLSLSGGLLSASTSAADSGQQPVVSDSAGANTAGSSSELRRDRSIADASTAADNSSDVSTSYRVRRVAVCCFGLTRSLDFTIDNLRRNILDALEKQGATYDIYLHTYNASHAQNPRAMEQDVPMDHTLFRLLHPASFEVENNVAFIDSTVVPLLPKLLKWGDPWNEAEPHVSLRNVVTALHSLKRVTMLMDASGKQYDAVLYTRTDLYFFKPLSLAALWAPGVPSQTIFLPGFHKWEGGFNDRFAVGHPIATRAYGLRYDQMLTYVERKKLHAENFCKYALKDMRVEDMRPCFLFSRVRATGQLWETPEPSGRCDLVSQHEPGEAQILLQLDDMSFWQRKQVLPLASGADG